MPRRVRSVQPEQRCRFGARMKGHRLDEARIVAVSRVAHAVATPATSAARGRSGHEGDRQPCQGAEVDAWAPLGTLRKRELPRARNESLERGLGLDARERCPNAVVNPAPQTKAVSR